MTGTHPKGWAGDRSGGLSAETDPKDANTTSPNNHSVSPRLLISEQQKAVIASNLGFLRDAYRARMPVISDPDIERCIEYLSHELRISWNDAEVRVLKVIEAANLQAISGVESTLKRNLESFGVPWA